MSGYVIYLDIYPTGCKVRRTSAHGRVAPYKYGKDGQRPRHNAPNLTLSLTW